MLASLKRFWLETGRGGVEQGQETMLNSRLMFFFFHINMHEHILL